MPVSFATDILPLFRPGDVSCMARFGVHLGDYSYMSDPSGGDSFPDHDHARDVYARLTGDATPRMPKGGPFWPPKRIALFNQWMTDGFQP